MTAEPTAVVFAKKRQNGGACSKRSISLSPGLQDHLFTRQAFTEHLPCVRQRLSWVLEKERKTGQSLVSNCHGVTRAPDT